jgi:hypothetical protein
VDSPTLRPLLRRILTDAAVDTDDDVRQVRTYPTTHYTTRISLDLPTDDDVRQVRTYPLAVQAES